MTESSFVQAQQRVAARRLAREAQAASHSEAARVDAQLQCLPFPFSGLSRAWRASSGRGSLRDGTAPPPPYRVAQVDAELLDEELLDLLRGQIGDALKYFAGGHPQDDWSAEILLALRAVLFKLTVWDHDATYGAALQNLRYADARRSESVLVPPSKVQKWLYGLVTVFGRYAWTKWEDKLLHQDDDDPGTNSRAQLYATWTSRLSTLHSAAALLSFCAFLLRGRYRTLLDRILRMRLAPPTSQLSREVSLEQINRQLVWHAFTEFLLFLLPLVGVKQWRRWLTRTWRKTRALMHAGADADDKHGGEYGFLPERTCGVCYADQNAGGRTEGDVLGASGGGGVVGSAQTDVTNPYETVPCGCVYCYVCVATRLDQRDDEDGWACLRCGTLVTACRPWRGDVLEVEHAQTVARRKGGAVKAVAFSKEVEGGVEEEEDEIEWQGDTDISSGE